MQERKKERKKERKIQRDAKYQNSCPMPVIERLTGYAARSLVPYGPREPALAAPHKQINNNNTNRAGNQKSVQQALSSVRDLCFSNNNDFVSSFTCLFFCVCTIFHSAGIRK
jgi:hypothetical protein